MSSVTTESSPVHESIPGCRRGGASFAIGGTKSSGRVIGANDTIRLAVAGLNGRGGSHVGEFVKMPGVEITYLVDPDTRTYSKRLEQIRKREAASRRQLKTFAGCSTTSRSTPFRWPRPITGTP